MGVYNKNHRRPPTAYEERREKWQEEWAQKIEEQELDYGEPGDWNSPNKFNK